MEDAPSSQGGHRPSSGYSAGVTVNRRNRHGRLIRDVGPRKEETNNSELVTLAWRHTYEHPLDGHLSASHDVPVSDIPSQRPRRIHELASDLGISSKQMLSFAASLGIYAKSASSTLGPTEVNLITTRWRTARIPRSDQRRSGPNSSYGSTRRHPATASPVSGTVDEDPQEAAIRRNLGIPTAAHRGSSRNVAVQWRAGR
jgi:hypothetical protein